MAPGRVFAVLLTLHAVGMAAGQQAFNTPKRGDSSMLLEGRGTTGKIMRVACVGDSLTAGYHASMPSNSYPSRLQGLLGPDYLVMNFGHSGTTLTGTQPGYASKMPYTETPEYAASLASRADIVIIMIGSNDANRIVWDMFEPSFASIYKDFIRAYQNMESHPLVFIMEPPPLYRQHAYGMEQSVINEALPRLVQEVARQSRLPAPISIFSTFKQYCPDLNKNSCPYISGAIPSHNFGHDDGCHPNDDGYLLIAMKVQSAITPLAQLIVGLSEEVPSSAATTTEATSTSGAARRLASGGQGLTFPSPILV